MSDLLVMALIFHVLYIYPSSITSWTNRACWEKNPIRINKTSDTITTKFASMGIKWGYPQTPYNCI